MMKAQVLCVYLALFALTGCLGLNKPECDGNCYNGYGTKKYSDGGYEKGNWRNGQLYGSGKQFFGSTSKFAGDIYIGNFDNGYSGYGAYYGKLLDFVHKGYWKNGKPDGYSESSFGPHSSNPNWSYKGEWKDGKKSGYGVLYMGTVGRRAGIRYVGYWLNDNMEGQGKYYWPDGSRYEGHFSNDLFDGKATFFFNDGSKYNGNWYQGENPDFLKVLEQHSRIAKDRDTTLNKFFFK